MPHDIQETEESRSKSLPVELSMAWINPFRMHRPRAQCSALPAFIVRICWSACSPALKRELYKDIDKVWSERLVASWPTEGPLLLELCPLVRPGKLYHMFATKKMLQTSIDDGYGESLAMMFCEGV